MACLLYATSVSILLFFPVTAIPVKEGPLSETGHFEVQLNNCLKIPCLKASEHECLEMYGGIN
jgi:hypothetical protein